MERQRKIFKRIWLSRFYGINFRNSSHYSNEVRKLKKEILWKLFENTGKIEYYLEWKKEEQPYGSNRRGDI